MSPCQARQRSHPHHAPFPLAGDAGSRWQARRKQQNKTCTLPSCTCRRCWLAFVSLPSMVTKEMRPSLSRLHLQEMLARADRHGVAPISWEEMGEQKDLIAFSHGGVLCHGEVG